MQRIGSRIKSRRHDLDISAAELASRLNMSKATIHRYENGDIRNIKLPVVEAIARELCCNPGWLIGKSDSSETGGDSVGNEKHLELTVLLDEIIKHIGDQQCMTCNGKRMSRELRASIVSGLEVVLAMTKSQE